MKNINISNIHEENFTKDYFPNKLTQNSVPKNRMSLNKLNFTPNFNQINFDLTNNSSSNFSSPKNPKRFNTLNFNKTDFKPQNILEENISPENNVETIKTKFKNQSALNVSLNFMRGKSIKKTNRNSLNILNPIQIKNNMISTLIEENSSKFGKFFKKPLSFRVAEFEEKKENFVNRFFNPFSNEKNFEYKNSTNFQIKNSMSDTDDIEKVTLVNDQEELVKKYVLPEMRFISNEKRKEISNKYDINDNKEKFVIYKGNIIFLQDVLRADNKSRSKSPEDFTKKSLIHSDTKFGMFPKFLTKSCSFVKFSESPKNNPTKSYEEKNIYNFNNSNQFNNLNNYNNFNYDDSPRITDKIINFQNNLNNNTINSKNQFISHTTGFDSNKRLKMGNDTNTNFIIQEKENFTTKNILTRGYISNNGYEINGNKNIIKKKQTREIFLDYPKIRFPIQPYKKINYKIENDKNFLTNGSMLNDPNLMNCIKKENKKNVDKFRSTQEKQLTNFMSDNIDKLNVIEGKIQDVIKDSQVKMQGDNKLKRFSTNRSIEIKNF